MKKLLVVAVLAIAGFFAYQKFVSGPAQSIEDPVYGEVRVDIAMQGREIEAALFFRATGTADCRGRALASWASALKNCAQCSMRTPKCQDELPARYARLFDDVAISSPYLAANVGRAIERDGRIVIYGLSDPEGNAACEAMRKVIAGGYEGETYCVAASGN